MSSKKEIQDVKVPTQVQISRTCDLCGYTCTRNFDNWGVSSDFEVADTEITYKDGMLYPEGGSGNKFVIDLCPKCFKTKLIPWLQSQGADIQEGEWDY